MTVYELKQYLEKVPDKTPVVVPASDHSYREVECYCITAIHDSRYGYSEEDPAEVGRRRKVLVMR